MTRFEKEQALINRFKNYENEKIIGYAKKVKGQVDAALDEEYALIIEGKQPKAKKVEKKEFGIK